MNLQIEKLELIEWLVKQNDSDVVECVKKIKREHTNFYNAEKKLDRLQYKIQFLEGRSPKEQDECREFYKQYL